jgi:hypothetical protein
LYFLLWSRVCRKDRCTLKLLLAALRAALSVDL